MNKQQIEELIHRLYRDLGNDPSDLVQIKPVDGTWGTALSYEITRRDNKKAQVHRKGLDDQNDNNIKTSLRTFG